MPGSSVISRNVLADVVKDRLLQDIMSGRYPPHSRIVETAVARELGTSQAPVREALRGLEALGVIEITPFRGARVRRPTAEELLEAYEVRTELESLSARLAVPRMDDADLEELEAYGREMARAAAIEDRHAVAIADASFHAKIVEIARNATLERVWRSLEPFSRTYITLVAPGADALWTANLHVGILEALRARDPEMVVAELRVHFAEASARLVRGWTASSQTPAAQAEGATPGAAGDAPGE